VPFIVRWPGVVKPGSVCSDPICLASFLSTTADILGKKLPGNAGVDSFSILPDLRNPDNKTPTHKLIIHQSSKGKLAVRDGEWKFIACSGSGGWTAGGDDKPLQLYNMVKDCREHNNLIDAMPEIAEKLKKELETGVSSGATVPGRASANDTPVVIFTRSVSGKNANKGGRKKK
jgi:arylsulfatase A-like enzyme